MQANKTQLNIVGLIPAAGQAERLAPLPCSKEIYPIRLEKAEQNDDLRIKVVSEFLLESLHLAKADRVYIILRSGKWDIPQYLGSGKWKGMDFAYLIMDVPYGVPFTIDQAYSFVKDHIVFFGFPDIIFKPQDAFVRLLAKQTSNGPDVVLGLFNAPKPFATQHMVKINPKSQVCGFQINPSKTALQYTWIVAAWNPNFTHFLHEYVSIESKRYRKTSVLKKDRAIDEISMTQTFQAALQKGLKIDAIIFEEGSFMDIGSPENLNKVVINFPELSNLKENK